MHRRVFSFAVIAALASLLALLVMASQDAQPRAAVAAAAPITTAPATSQPFPAVPDPHRLHNGHVVTAKVISGAQPDGDASFEALRELGVKTIISVDGAKPDVERARKHGMRYVHLPIGYDGVEEAEGKAIAKAISELPGPIYVHCHHGKHRSAAAVAVACVYNGMLPPERAEAVLQTFGTGANYKGLWRAAREARPLPADALQRLDVKFVETARVAQTAEAMVRVDEKWEHLKQIQKNGWRPLADHPDLDPAHEALQLQEMLHEMRRTGSPHANAPDYLKLLTQGEDGARALRDALAAKPLDAQSAEKAFKSVAASCTSCHQSYRD